jgi:protein-disulfide isomerase
MTAALLSLLVAAQLAARPAAPVASVAPAAPPQVEIAVFSDFQCPFCARFATAIRELQETGAGGIKPVVRFKNFPLSFHPRAPLAHQAALAAGEQGKFWEMHDLLFLDQSRVQREHLVGYASKLGLDLPRFLSDLDSDRVKRTIEADVAEGTRLRVDGTPTFYVNGRRYVGARSLAQLKDLVVAEDRRARALAEITDELTSKGPAAAPVTLELFADLQSPVTPPALAVLNTVMERYPSSVRVQFRNFPLAFHPQAVLAHEAAMTAARSGRFWEFAAYLLEHQDALREQDLIALAGRVGLDREAFAATMQEHRYAPRVDADVRAGSTKGLRGSPVILVNGRRIDGVPSLQTLITYVDAALAERRVNAVR